MNAKRTLVLLLLLPVLAAGVWWLLRDPGSAGGLTGTASGPDAANPGTAAAMAREQGGGEDTPDPSTAPASPRREPARVAAATADGAGALIGRIVDAEGAPVAGARILCRMRRSIDLRLEDMTQMDPAELRKRFGDSAPALEDVSDADGAFRLPVPAGKEELRISVQARGYKLLKRKGARPSGDDVDLGALVLLRGAVIAGRVTDSGGRPVKGARVRRVPPGQQMWFGDFELAGAEGIDRDRVSETRTRTDERGHFELAHSSPGPFSLRVTHAEHPAGMLENQSIEAGEVLDDLLVVLESGSEITGRITGVPAETSGLRILARAVKESSGGTGPAAILLGNPSDIVDGVGFAVGERSVEVADDGTFALRGLDPKKVYGVWAVQGGAGFLQMNACTQRSEVPAGTRGIELRFLEGVTVTFAVVDAGTGDPLTELRVAPKMVGGSGLAAMFANAIGARARWSDYPNGHVTLAHLRPKKKQKLSLRVEALGYAPLSREKVDLPERGELDLGTLSLRRAPVVRVHVTDGATGQPVVAAAVRISVVEEDNKDQKSGGGSISYTTSVHVGGESSGLDGVTMSFGGDSDKTRSGKTDADGWCVLNGFPGKDVKVTVRSPEHAPYHSDEIGLPVADDTEHRVGMLVGGDVEVLVLDSNGQPVAQATVQHKSGASGGGSEKTDAKGVARFSRLAPGTHRFKLRRKRGGGLNVSASINVGGSKPQPDPGWEDVDVRDAVQATLTLTQPATGRLAGVVRENGLPLGRARVSFVAGPGGGADAESEQLAEMQSRLMSFLPDGGGSGSSSRADGDGSYELKDLPVGDHRLRITHRDRAMSTLVPVTVIEGDSTFDIELDMTAIRGRVVDADGKPVEGARIAIAPALAGEAREAASAMEGLFGGASNAFGISSQTGEIKTDVDGEFELRGVRPDAPLVVRARARGFAPAVSAELRVSRGTVHRGVDLRLAPAGEIAVRLVGDAPAFSAVRATFKGEGAEAVAPVMGFLKSGRATLEGLRPGSWEVQWSPSDGGDKQTRTVEVVAGKPTQVQFQL